MDSKKIYKESKICIELGGKETVIYANKEGYKTLIDAFKVISKSKAKDLYHLHLKGDLNLSHIEGKGGRRRVTVYSRKTKKLLTNEDYEMIFYLSDDKELKKIVASYKKKKPR